jgi:hypothetical protein
MKNLKQKEESPEQRFGPGDYYEVVSRYGNWYVSPETAARIGRVLDRHWRPRWLKFVDINGARAWVRTDTIEYVNESTERQRTGSRAFDYLLHKERQADRRWDDDEC